MPSLDVADDSPAMTAINMVLKSTRHQLDATLAAAKLCGFQLWYCNVREQRRLEAEWLDSWGTTTDLAAQRNNYNTLKTDYARQAIELAAAQAAGASTSEQLTESRKRAEILKAEADELNARAVQMAIELDAARQQVSNLEESLERAEGRVEELAAGVEHGTTQLEQQTQHASKLQQLHCVLSELLTGAALRKRSQLASTMLQWWRWAELQRVRSTALDKLQRSVIEKMQSRMSHCFHGWVQCTAKAATGERHSMIVCSMMRRFNGTFAMVRAFGKWQAMTINTMRDVLTQQTELLSQKIEEMRGQQVASEEATKQTVNALQQSMGTLKQEVERRVREHEAMNSSLNAQIEKERQQATQREEALKDELEAEKQQHNDDVNTEKQRHEHEMQAEKQRYEVDTKNLREEQRLYQKESGANYNALVGKHKEELEAILKQHRNELEDLKAEYVSGMELVRTQHEQYLQTLKSEADNEKLELAATHNQALHDAQEQMLQQEAALRQEHLQAIAVLKQDLTERHAAEKSQMREDALQQLDTEREKLLEARNQQLTIDLRVELERHAALQNELTQKAHEDQEILRAQLNTALQENRMTASAMSALKKANHCGGTSAMSVILRRWKNTAATKAVSQWQRKMCHNRAAIQLERNKHELIKVNKELSRAQAAQEAAERRAVERVRVAEADSDKLRPQNEMQVNQLQQTIAELHADMREKTGRCSALQHQLEAAEREKARLHGEVAALVETRSGMENSLHHKSSMEAQLMHERDAERAAREMEKVAHEQMLQQLGEAHGRAVEGLKASVQQSNDQSSRALQEQELAHRTAMESMKGAYEQQLAEVSEQLRHAVEMDKRNQEQAAHMRMMAAEEVREGMFKEYRELEDELNAIRAAYGEQDRRQQAEIAESHTQIQMLSNELSLSRLQLVQKQELEDELSQSISGMKQTLY